MFFPTALIADTYEVCLHAHMGKKKKKDYSDKLGKIEHVHAL